MADEKPQADWDTLVGKAFHELGEDGYVERQGIILGEPYPQVFIVQHFEWIAGNPSFGERLVTLDNMLKGKWQFYATIEDMNEAHDYGGIARRRDPTPPTQLP